jgi:hypothetical protein
MPAVVMGAVVMRAVVVPAVVMRAVVMVTVVVVAPFETAFGLLRERRVLVRAHSPLTFASS